MKFTYIMGTSSAEFRLLFHKVSLIINIRSHHLWDAVCCSHKTLCSRIRGLHARCLSAHRILKYSLIVHHSGRQKDGSRRVLNQDCGENEGEWSAPLLQLCAEWCVVGVMRGRTWFIFMCGRTLQIHCFNLCNICTYRLNWLRHLCPWIPLTRFHHCPTRC
jgi:hypothetical protein